eukprot:3574052-Pyramimonas_sp.AAC.1
MLATSGAPPTLDSSLMDGGHHPGGRIGLLGPAEAPRLTWRPRCSCGRRRRRGRRGRRGVFPSDIVTPTPAASDSALIVAASRALVIAASGASWVL